MSIISVDNLTFCYDGSYDNIFENVSFKIDTDWRLGFIGRNGRGKTTFLNLLMGRYRYSGSVSAAVSFDYFPFEVPDASMTTLEVIESVSPDYEHWRLMKELNLMKATEDILYRPFSTLSNDESPACGAVYKGKQLPPHRRADQPSGYGSAPDGKRLSKEQEWLYTGIA